MSCLASSYVGCATLQADLTTYFNTCGAEMIREPMPLAEFLTSAVNNNGLSQVIAPGSGKTRSVELTYQARIPESQVTENDSDLCSCATTRGNCSQTYTIDPAENLSVCETISAANLRAICMPNDQFILKKIAHLVDVLERRAATEMVQELSFLTGSWNTTEVPNVNVSDQLVVKTKKDGDAFTPNPFAMSEIDFALAASGYCAPAAIFGGRELYQYYRNMLAGCCSDAGNDLAAHLSLYGRAVAYDPRVAATISGGQNAGLVIQPGAVALLTWNEYGWNFGTDPIFTAFQTGSNYTRTMFVSPRLGLPMDVIVKDECPGTLTIVVSVVIKLVNLPSDIFPVGDKYRGVNFVNELLVTNV